MKDWWATLPARDQRVLLFGSLALTAILGWLLLWEPLQLKREQLRADNAQLQADLSWMQQVAPEVRRRAAGSGRASVQRPSAGSILSLVEVSASAAGLREQLERIQPEGQGARLWLEAVAFDRLMAWLATRQPPDAGRAALIHNDYKFDNVVLGERDGRWRITGVLDWEMATLGDPLMDLGASLAYWIEADDPAALQGIRMLPTHLPGMMRRAELVDYYFERTGLAAERFDFYYAYGLFRLAVIVQQIYYRFVLGQTKNPRFAPFGRFCCVLSEAAAEVAGGRRPFKEPS